MSKKPYHHGNLRLEAIDEAIALSNKKGLFSWSLRELSMHMGVSHVALYKHFKTKNDLLYCVAIHGFKQLINKTKNKKDFKAAGEVYIKFAINHPVIFEAMFHPQLPPSGSEELREISSEYLNIAKSKIEVTSEDELSQVFLKGWASVHGFALLSTRNILKHLDMPKEYTKPKGFVEFLWKK